LLLAVRSSPEDVGAPSAPAILNIGLTRDVLLGLLAEIGAHEASKLRRRLIQSFVVAFMGANPAEFENALYDAMRQAGADTEEDLTTEAMTALEDVFLALVEDETGDAFPESAERQIMMALQSMQRAWDAPTARILRQAKGGAPGSGQSFIVQAMALGIGPAPSGAGVAMLRSEETGLIGLSGRFLSQAQGSEALMGLRTPRLLPRRGRGTEGQSE